jgi:nucleoside-diphosphate-sugar epimerase
MCLNHDQSWSWQNCIKFMMNGKPYRKSKGGRMLWNLVDVRDVARAHRLAAKTTVGGNGSRYILSAEDRSSRSSTIESVRAHGDFDGVEQLPLSFHIHTRRTAPRIGPA